MSIVINESNHKRRVWEALPKKEGAAPWLHGQASNF